MISYRIPPEDSNRIVTQFIPDTTGKTCEFRHVSAAPDTQFLPSSGGRSSSAPARTSSPKSPTSPSWTTSATAPSRWATWKRKSAR